MKSGMTRANSTAVAPPEDRRKRLRQPVFWAPQDVGQDMGVPKPIEF